MTKMAGSVADGIHVHPFHSMHYLHERLVPAVTEGAAEAGRTFDDVDLIIPVFAIPGDTTEDRSALFERTRFQIAFRSDVLRVGKDWVRTCQFRWLLVN